MSVFKKSSIFMAAASVCALTAALAAEEGATSPFVESDDDNPIAATTLKDRSLSDYAQWRRPAASDSRPASDYVDNYARNAGDAFFFAPGVWVNSQDLNEQRLVLRGFAVNNRVQRSNVMVLRDGAPLTDVHGVTNLREVDLLAVNRVDIFRGGAGSFLYSGDNLGGVVNFVSPTGQTSLAGLGGRVDAGSSIEGTPGGRAHFDLAGGSSDGMDYFLSVTGGYDTGFRVNNELKDGVINGNIGFRLSPRFKTRFFLEAIYSDAELAGGLLPADAATDPSQAAPPITLGPLFPGGPIIEFADGAEEDNFNRNLLVGRVSNQTNFGLLGHEFDLGLHYTRREVESAQIDFIGVIEESGNEWGARLSARRDLQFFNMDAAYRFGGGYTTGAQDSDRFENNDGEAGFQTVDTEQKSTNINAFVEAALRPFKKLLIDFGAKFIIGDRELTVDNGDTPDEDERFTGIAAKLGAIYDLTDNIQIFANASRTYEPPTLAELVAGDSEDFNGLDEQDSFTYEAGVRGRLNEWIGWDVTYFNSDIENEIINLDEPETNGLGATLANVPQTTHKGFEVGLDIDLLPARRGQSLTLRNVYAYNDFRFVDSGFFVGNFDGNRIGGIPQHVYRGELRYDEVGRWFAAVNVQAFAGDFYADHANTFTAPGDIVLGFSAGMQLTDQAVLFVSGENITDTNYAAGVTQVTDQSVLNGRIFTPAARASVYGGLKYRF